MPAGSVAVTDNTEPLTGTGTGSQLNAPDAEATAVHSTVPAAFLTVTVEPGSAEPVMGEPSVAFSTGVAGAEASVVADVVGDVLPAGSVAVTDSAAPLAGTTIGVHENVPAAVAVAVQTVEPAASFTVTVEPGSAEPVTGEPSVGATTGAVGATASATTAVGLELSPTRLVAATVSTWPLTGAGAGLHVNAPVTGAATAEQSTLPAESRTRTTVPGVAVPVTGEPSVGLTIGASTAVLLTVCDVAAETLPSGSVAVTEMTAALAGTRLSGSALGVHENVPAAVAVVVQSTVPAALRTVTVEPASAEPVMGEPSVELTAGAAGAAESVVTEAGADVLPRASVAVTDSTVPLAGVVAGTHENVPATVAVVVQTVTPAASFTVTVEPGSAEPAMGEPSLGLTPGAVGAAESTTTVVGVEMLPAGSVAVTTRVAEFTGIGIGLHENVPSTAATVEHSSVPSGSRTAITEPGTAVPETGEPSVGLTAGAAGATPSTMTETAPEVLPAASVAVIDNVEPLAGTGLMSQL